MKTPEQQADLRVRRTHKLLWEALMAELSQRSFEEITVKAVCERAMVHRTTFYKHYEDKYALLEQGMRQMYDTLLAEVNMPSALPSVNDPHAALVGLFVHVAEHQQFYKLMLCGDGISRFQKLVKEYITEHTEVKISTVTPVDQALMVPPAVQSHVFAGALISILAWWLENDMPLPPKQVAHYFLSLHRPLFAHCS